MYLSPIVRKILKRRWVNNKCFTNYKEVKMKQKLIRNIVLCLLIVVMGVGVCVIFESNKSADTVHASTYNLTPDSYQLNDNTGYNPSGAYQRYMVFNSKSIGYMNLYGVSSQGSYNGTPAFSSEVGENIKIEFKLRYNNKNSINNTVWRLSGDSATSVNGINLNGSSIGQGAIVVQRRRLNQNNYDVLKTIGNVFSSNNKFEYTSLNGEDINTGAYYRISVAYEVYRTWTEKQGWWIFVRNVQKSEYKNCLEVYNFFIARNSCNIQYLELADKDYTKYTDDSSRIEIIKKGDTLSDGSVTTKGFKINYLDNKSFTVEYSKNGGSFVKVRDGQKITANGAYSMRVTSLFGNTKTTNITVYNGEQDQGYTRYFGQSAIVGDRVADITKALPTYKPGVKLALNSLPRQIPALHGIIKNNSTGFIRDVNESYARQEVPIYDEGVYTINLINGDENKAGTTFRYEFNFIVADLSSVPSINMNNVLSSITISDYDAKHIEVKYNMPSNAVAHICFDSNDYLIAYQFAYALEKKYISEGNNGYYYHGAYYADNISLVNAINEHLTNIITVEYFINNYTQFYLDEDLLHTTISIDSLNKDKDIYVTTTDQINKMLNKENILDSSFQFVKIGDFESKTIVARNMDTNRVYNLAYNRRLGDMLTETGKYEITETNKYNETTVYEIVYCCNNATVVNVTVDGANHQLTNSNYQIINNSNVKISSVVNSLDSDGVVMIANLSTLQRTIMTNAEVSELDLSGADYLVTIIDRSGNIFSFVINGGANHFTSVLSAVQMAQNIDYQFYSHVISKGVSSGTATLY